MDTSNRKPGPAAMQTRPQRRSQSDEDAGDRIVILLTRLSYARQVTADANVLAYFAGELERFNYLDVESAIELLCKTRRQDGETAFPDLATMIEAVEAAARSRRIAEAKQARKLSEEEERRHREAHPEEYVSVKEIFDAARVKNVFSMEKKNSANQA